jgi:hypothetical protein
MGNDGSNDSSDYDLQAIFEALEELKLALVPYDPICVYFIEMRENALREHKNNKSSSH